VGNLFISEVSDNSDVHSSDHDAFPGSVDEETAGDVLVDEFIEFVDLSVNFDLILHDHVFDRVTVVGDTVVEPFCLDVSHMHVDLVAGVFGKYVLALGVDHLDGLAIDEGQVMGRTGLGGLGQWQGLESDEPRSGEDGTNGLAQGKVDLEAAFVSEDSNVLRGEGNDGRLEKLEVFLSGKLKIMNRHINLIP